MNADESLEEDSEPRPTTVDAESLSWSETFLKHLEIYYSDAAARLSPSASHSEFRRAMVQAVVTTLADSGASPDEIAHLIKTAAPWSSDADARGRWTSDMNIRRVALIDKMIQRTISPTEAAELDRLTALLRAHADTEELVQVEGAQLLHKHLLDMDSL